MSTPNEFSNNETSNNEVTPQTIADRYIAAWNETDPAARRERIAQAWMENATYRDPLMSGQGHAQLALLVEGAQQQFSGFRFVLASKAEQVGDLVRFSWHLMPPEGEAVAGGTDFCTLAEDSRLQSVTGFLDFAPGLPA